MRVFERSIPPSPRPPESWRRADEDRDDQPYRGRLDCAGEGGFFAGVCNGGRNSLEVRLLRAAFVLSGSRLCQQSTTETARPPSDVPCTSRSFPWR